MLLTAQRIDANVGHAELTFHYAHLGLAELAERAGETFDRGYSASGMMRQMMAIIKQPDRTHRLRSLRVPALVVHGMADKMVHVSGGRSTAAAIPGAELLLVDGMGHDLPPALYETFVEAIGRTADRVSA